MLKQRLQKELAQWSPVYAGGRVPGWQPLKWDAQGELPATFRACWATESPEPNQPFTLLDALYAGTVTGRLLAPSATYPPTAFYSIYLS